MRMHKYQLGWDKMRIVFARSVHRSTGQTLLQSSEEFKIKKALIENLNTVYDLHEFSGDNIFYCSLRGCTHPNAPDRNRLENARFVQRSEWDSNDSRETPRWMRSEYLNIRLRQYGRILKEVASFSLSNCGNLEVCGTSMLGKPSPSPDIRLPSLSVSVDLANNTVTVLNNTCTFIFWSVNLSSQGPAFYTIEPTDGGVYPSESFKLCVRFLDNVTTLPDEVWSITTESGESIPIHIP